MKIKLISGEYELTVLDGLDNIKAVQGGFHFEDINYNSKEATKEEKAEAYMQFYKLIHLSLSKRYKEFVTWEDVAKQYSYASMTKDLQAGIVFLMGDQPATRKKTTKKGK